MANEICFDFSKITNYFGKSADKSNAIALNRNFTALNKNLKLINNYHNKLESNYQKLYNLCTTVEVVRDAVHNSPTDPTMITIHMGLFITNFLASFAFIESPPNLKTNLKHLNSFHVAAFKADSKTVKTLLEVEDNANDLNTAEPVEGFTPLHCAVFANATSVVEAFLNHKSLDVNAQTKAGLTALHIAAIQNSTEIFKMLLQNPKIDLNVASLDGWTALHFAVSNQNFDIVAELLKFKSKLKINAQMVNQVTPLHIAARHDDKYLTEILLENGADIETRTEDGWTAFQIAEKFNCCDALYVFKIFLEKSKQKSGAASASESPTCEAAALITETDATVALVEKSSPAEHFDFETNGDDDKATSKLFQATFKGKLEQIKSLLSQGAAHFNPVHKSGKSLLDFAILSGNAEVFEYIFAAQNYNKISENLLFKAAELGSFAIAKYLIEVKALNPHLKSEKNQTLLCAAIAGGNFELVQYLIEDQGLKVTGTAENCPLCSAIEIKNLTMIEYCLGKGSNIAGVCDQRRPILIAAEKSNLSIFKYLLKNGANIDVKYDGKGVFDYAALGGNLDILLYLVKEKGYKLNTKIHGSNLSILFHFARVGTLEAVKYLIEVEKFSFLDKGPSNGTILHEAAFNRNLDVIKYFVEVHCLDVKARSANGFVPLFYAVQENNLAAVKYFVEEKNLGIHLKDNRNRSVLHLAVLSERLEVLQYLVEKHHPNLNIRDNDGLTPLTLAIQNIRIDAVNFLLNRDKQVSILDKIIKLFSAAKDVNSNMIKYLIKEKGMKANFIDSNGQKVTFDRLYPFKVVSVQYWIESKQVDFHLKYLPLPDYI